MSCFGDVFYFLCHHLCSVVARQLGIDRTTSWCSNSALVDFPLSSDLPPLAVCCTEFDQMDASDTM